MKRQLAAAAFALAFSSTAWSQADDAVLPEAEQPVSETPLAPPPAGLLNELPLGGEFGLRPGDTLRDTLVRWARAAGWTLVWHLDYDLPVQATIDFPPGTRFKDAVRLTLKAYWGNPKSVTGCAYRNRALVVIRAVERCPR